LTPINKHIARMYEYLGVAYAATNNDEKAVECFNKVREMAPLWATPICHMGSLLIKRNELDKALGVYYEARQSPFYGTEEVVVTGGKKYVRKGFKNIIEKRIDFLEDKIKRGYIFSTQKGWIKKR